MSRQNKSIHSLAVAVGLTLMLAGFNANGDDTFSEYRDMLGGDNPAVFLIEDGAEIWTQERGPNKVSLERCDLGLGPGVVAGAYAQLPRYFEDTDKVMNLEGRLVHCMVVLQGMDRAKVLAKPYSGRAAATGTDIEALVAYVADQSEGMQIAVPQQHAKEQAAYAAGKKLFYYRAGPYDFSCASCHRQTDKRIRLQVLPNLTKAEDAMATVSTWPAYRISQGVVRTMGWRMRSCVRQQRLPELQLGSEATVDLMSYMGVNAAGASMAAPGLKR